jgi:hypothetical protein
MASTATVAPKPIYACNAAAVDVRLGRSPLVFEVPGARAYVGPAPVLLFLYLSLAKDAKASPSCIWHAYDRSAVGQRLTVP